jgi:flagellar biosynthetic protein FliQ
MIFESVDDAVVMAREALSLALELSLPVIATVVVVGLVTSVFQALVQIRDEVLSLGPRLVLAAICVLALVPWYLSELSEYARVVWTHIGTGAE